jgi:citrate lyase subunit beta/citryl-CoA lyase
MRMHPREVLLGAQAGAVKLPVCDHYSGVAARMRKSLALQAEFIERLGACVFDVTLDCEDGAPAGGEAEHAALVTELVRAVPTVGSGSGAGAGPQGQRVGVRVHAVGHPSFEADVATLVGQVGGRLAYLMLPKVESVADVEAAAAAIAAAGHPQLPLHVLIESPLAVHRAFDIAAHPAVESMSFGLMDFVSAHGGAIPAYAMGVDGQFSHPLVQRAKMELASACHAHGKVPSHCVVTEFKDGAALGRAARRAATELAYTRMWSIHPDQIQPIIDAFAPAQDEVERAAAIIGAAEAAHWGPISHQGHLHDRASFRYFWQVLERAHQTGVPMPPDMQGFFQTGHAPRR